MEYFNINFISRILCLFKKHKWCYGIDEEGRPIYENDGYEHRFCEYCGKEEQRSMIISGKYTEWKDIR